MTEDKEFKDAMFVVQRYVNDMRPPTTLEQREFEKAVLVVDGRIKNFRELIRGEKFEDGEGWVYCNGGCCDCHLLCATVETMLCSECPEEETCCDGKMNHERHNKMLTCLSVRLYPRDC